MKQTRKGNNWHFGTKLHVATDRRGTALANLYALPPIDATGGRCVL
jgi:hypothetical protein